MALNQEVMRSHPRDAPLLRDDPHRQEGCHLRRGSDAHRHQDASPGAYPDARPELDRDVILESGPAAKYHRPAEAEVETRYRVARGSLAADAPHSVVRLRHHRELDD